MIYVSKDQLEQVEYLIAQSIRGNHVLFDTESIRRAFHARARPANAPLNAPMNVEEAYGVEHHIERMILQPSLAGKRAYLDKLDHGTFERVVRTYFNIVENNLYEKDVVRH